MILGAPYHGLVQDGQLTLPNGQTIAYPQPDGGDCLTFRVPGTPAVVRTPEEQAADAAAGHQWLDYVLISGRDRRVYGLPTRSSCPGAAAENIPNSWLLHSDGRTWLMRVTAVTQIATNPAQWAINGSGHHGGLRLSLSARPFGEIGIGGQNLTAEVTIYANPADTIVGTAWGLRAVRPLSEGGSFCILECDETQFGDPYVYFCRFGFASLYVGISGGRIIAGSGLVQTVGCGPGAWQEPRAWESAVCGYFQDGRAVELWHVSATGVWSVRVGGVTVPEFTGQTYVGRGATDQGLTTGVWRLEFLTNNLFGFVLTSDTGHTTFGPMMSSGGVINMESVTVASSVPQYHSANPISGEIIRNRSAPVCWV